MTEGSAQMQLVTDKLLELAKGFSLEGHDEILQECAFTPLHFHLFAGATEAEMIAQMDKMVTKQGVLRSAFRLATTAESDSFMDGGNFLLASYA